MEFWLCGKFFVLLASPKGTHVRKNKEKRVFLWFFTHLFVPLQAEFEHY